MRTALVAALAGGTKSSAPVPFTPWLPTVGWRQHPQIGVREVPGPLHTSRRASR